MNIEEFVYAQLTAAGLKTSSNADAAIKSKFSIYNLIDLEPNYLGSATVKTNYEQATLSFNCFGATKGEAYNEVRAVEKCLSALQENSSDVDSSLVYGIQNLPKMDGLFGYTVMATIVYLNSL